MLYLKCVCTWMDSVNPGYDPDVQRSVFGRFIQDTECE